MVRILIACAAVALLATFEASAQTSLSPQAPCKPTASRPCPALAPVQDNRTITYSDPFKTPEPKRGPGRIDNEQWNTPRIQLDHDTSIGIGGLERKF